MIPSFFHAVLDVTWRASWLILAVLCLRRLLRDRVPARVVFWVWIAVVVRLLLPVSFPAVWSPFRDRSVDRPAVVLARNTVSLAGDASDRLAVAPTQAMSAGDGTAVPAQASIGWTGWCAIGWAIGAAVLLSARVYAYGRFARALRRSAVPETINDPRDGAVTVWVTDAVSAPALHGVFRPRLLLPPRFIESVTPAELRHVVDHELAHAARRDLLVHSLARGATILHWFNPLVWLAVQRMREDCELACDETVVRRMSENEREAYGATLLKIVTLGDFRTLPPLGLGVVESKRQIKRRIHMIAAPKSSTVTGAVLAGAVLALATVLTLSRETQAAPAPTLTPAAPPVDSAVPARKTLAKAAIVYDTAHDGLDRLFPDGVVARVSDRTVTVADVRREIQPLIPMLQQEARSQKEFDERVNKLQNSVVEQLVGRVLRIKEFHQSVDGEPERKVAAESVDKAFADRVNEQFGGDRAKFLAYLQDRGETLDGYRSQVEEDIIYSYMRAQERKLDGTTSRAKTPGPGSAHIRVIQLSRQGSETDAELTEKANAILARLKNGESFAALAQEFDRSSRAKKGGDWGWITRDELKPSIADRVAQMKPGEVSAPILMSDACMLIYVEDRK